MDGMCPRRLMQGHSFSFEQQVVRNDIRKFIQSDDGEGILRSIETIRENGWTHCLSENLADAINFFCDKNDLETAEKLVDCHSSNCQFDSLDKWKVLKYIRLLLDHDRMDDALKFLDAQPALRDREKACLERLVDRVLSSANRTGNREKIGMLREMLKTRKFL